jgi:predicted anti-sigma-YlaC factor YlaD
MTRCPESDRIESWLDRELPAPAAAEFERHLRGCEPCAREARALEALYASLQRVPVWDPGPSLTERILDHVAPSRLRRRQITLVGWAYSAVSAVTTFAFISWIVRPGTHVWLGQVVAAGYSRLIDTGLLALDTVMGVALRLHQGWGLVEVVGGWIVPVVRALATLAVDPAVAAPLWASIVACSAIIWWLRPRPVRVARGRNGHVGILAL